MDVSLDKLFYLIANGDLIETICEYKRIEFLNFDLSQRILKQCIRDAQYYKNWLLVEFFNDMLDSHITTKILNINI